MARRPPTCRSCAHFDDDPASIERQLPGITILGSAYGSVRGDAGICGVLNRFMEPLPADGCAHFAARAVKSCALRSHKDSIDRGKSRPFRR